MQFGSSPAKAAQGGILAHTIRSNGLFFRKGRVLSEADVKALVEARVGSVVIARLEENDIGEDEAAARLARALAGPNVRVGAAFTGRANLYALEHGLAMADGTRIDAVNLVDESITLATAAPFSRVAPRQMLATVKIIPFAAPKVAVAAAEAALAGTAPALRVAPFRPMRAALVSTILPGTKPALLDKNRAALDVRLTTIGSEIVLERRTAHEVTALATAIRKALSARADPILIFGASAITDRQDVIPAAIVEAGGQIDHFGMPVDPGNLLLLGRIGETIAVGLPGCARSPKLNGIDFVLWRIAAGQALGRKEIAAMGVGGLLSEIATRPQPRDEKAIDIPRLPRIAAVVLAAGRSTRMGSNKLLLPVGGSSLIRHAAEAAARSAANPVVLVTGNGASDVADAVAGLPLRFANNPDYEKGLSSSLKCGLAALPEDCDGAVVLLGDMPGVTSALVDKLIAAFDPTEGRGICVASRHGKRGNPVLWARRFFPEIASLEGDVGARHLMALNEDFICEVEAGDDGPLIDIDTQEALAAYRAQ